MKFFSNLRNHLRMKLRKNVLGNEKGQGATEYIMLLVVIVGLIMIFKNKIKDKVGSSIEQLGSQMDNVSKD